MKYLLSLSIATTSLLTTKALANESNGNQKPVWEMSDQERAEYRARVMLRNNPNSIINNNDTETQKRINQSGQYKEEFLQKHNQTAINGQTTSGTPANQQNSQSQLPQQTQNQQSNQTSKKTTQKNKSAQAQQQDKLNPKNATKNELTKQNYGLDSDTLKNKLKVVRLWDFQSWNKHAGQSDWWTYDVTGNSHAKAVGLARPTICFDKNNNSDYNRALEVENGKKFSPYLISQEASVTDPELQLKFKQGEDFTIGGWVRYVGKKQSQADGVAVMSKAAVNGQDKKRDEWVWYLSGNVVGFNFNRVFTGEKYYYDDLEVSPEQSGEVVVSQKSKKPIDQQPPTTPINPPNGSVGGMNPGTIFKQHLVEFDMKSAPLSWWAHTPGSCYVDGKHFQCWVFISMSFRFSDRNDPHVLLTFMKQPVGSYNAKYGDYNFTHTRKTVKIKLDKTLSAQQPYHSDNPVRIGASLSRSYNGNLKGLFIAKKFLDEVEVTQLARAYQPGQNFNCEFKDAFSEINYLRD